MPSSSAAPPRGHAEAGDHLVEDQQRAVLRGQVAAGLQELRRAGCSRPLLAGTGSMMSAATSLPRAAKNASSFATSSSGSTTVVSAEALGHAGAAGRAEGGQPAARLHQQAVGVAVVAAAELDGHVAAGEAARQADGAHHGLGAAADEAHLVEVRHARQEGLGQQHLAAAGGAEAGALVHGLERRGVHLGVGVAQDERAPAQAPVDVRLAVLVGEAAALRRPEEQRDRPAPT